MHIDEVQYVCAHVCVYNMYAHVCVYICMHMHVYTYVCTCMCIHALIKYNAGDISTNALWYVCVHVGLYRDENKVHTHVLRIFTYMCTFKIKRACSLSISHMCTFKIKRACSFSLSLCTYADVFVYKESERERERDIQGPTT